MSRVRLVNAGHVSADWLWGEQEPLLPGGAVGELSYTGTREVRAGLAWRVGAALADVEVLDLVEGGGDVELAVGGRVLVSDSGFGTGVYPVAARSVDGLLVEVQADFGLEQVDWAAAARGESDPARLVAIGRGALGAEDVDTARAVFTRAAEAGDAKAMSGLGNLAHGDGDDDQARVWWRRAADAGRLQALVNLGLVTNAQGDSDGAAALWVEAVDRWSGDEEQRGAAVEAMVRLGAHANDHGDRALEVEWLDRAATADPADPAGFVFGVDGMRELSWSRGETAAGVLGGVVGEEASPDGPWRGHPIEWGCALTLWALDPGVSAGLEVNDFATRLLAAYPDPQADGNPHGPLVLRGPTLLTRPQHGSGVPGIPRLVLDLLDGFTDQYIDDRHTGNLPADPTDGFDTDHDDEDDDEPATVEQLTRAAADGDGSAMANLGYRLAEEEGDLVGAERWYRAAIPALTHAGDDAAAASTANNLAFQVLIPGGRYDDARHVLHAAVDLDAGYQSVNAMSNLGVVEFATGNHAEAKALFRAVVDSGDGPQEEARYYLGMIAEAAGNVDKARKQWKKAAESDDQEYATKARAALARTQQSPRPASQSVPRVGTNTSTPSQVSNVVPSAVKSDVESNWLSRNRGPLILTLVVWVVCGAVAFVVWGLYGQPQ